ncbi:1-acyl-sn-glycerol-3-phosphate acyltransferase [Gilvimarinus sp. F26214L]|uniref:1-acyl-sn-glycerol-3-phosphate acyltransferase n=1 Tax=Gilvimarinus sp. DZF01 TaxID=3461371 RepID=UPI00404687DD
MADLNEEFYKQIPDTFPRTNHPWLSRWGKWVYSRLGWSFQGEVPELSKAVVILAPHTSNWDFFIALIAKFALNLKASYVMKQEAFFWPFKNWLIRIGGIPIDRTQPKRIVSRVTREFREKDSIWLVITPEGTRRKVDRYKTGFVRIAHAAGVPVIVVGLDFSRKAIVFSRVVSATGDHDADADALYHFCRDNFRGRNPQNQ